MIIKIEVKNRTATYRSTGSDPVCGSNADQVQFLFDEEWADVPVKTARFIWGDQYYDEEFVGDTCPAPMFFDVTRVYVGVYAGEPVIGEPSLSTTKAEVPYGLSVRCGYTTPRPESGESFTNEAKGYALEAKEAAEDARAVVSRAHEVVEAAIGLKEVGRFSLTLHEVECMDAESGAYYATWQVGNKLIDLKNGSILLKAMGALENPPEDMTFADQIIELMRCPITKVQLIHPDLDGVLLTTTVFDKLADGEAWKPMSVPETDSDWHLFDDAWFSGGVRLVSTDNPYAPGVGYGPSAVFLQFPLEFRDAMTDAVLIPETDYNSIQLTFIGYC